MEEFHWCVADISNFSIRLMLKSCEARMPVDSVNGKVSLCNIICQLYHLWSKS